MKETESDTEDVQRLIRLKRFETPGEEYYRNFAEEFKDRQRAELLHCSARSLLAERVNVWWDEVNGSRWLVPVGAAAAIGVGVLLVSGVANENVPASHVVADESRSAESTLPAFPESTDEIIELKLPKPETRAPGTPSFDRLPSGTVLPANARGSLREL